MGIFERAPGSVTGGTVRKSLSWIGGRGFTDPVPRADEMRSSAVATASITSEGTGGGSDASGEVPRSSVLGSLGSSGEDLGDEARILNEELVKSPTEL